MIENTIDAKEIIERKFHRNSRINTPEHVYYLKYPL